MRAVRAALPRVPLIVSISFPPLAHARRRARSLARSQSRARLRHARARRRRRRRRWRRRRMTRAVTHARVRNHCPRHARFQRSVACRAIIMRTPCDLPNARLWRRRWRQRRRARGRRACGGAAASAARARGGGSAGQPRRSAAAVLNGGRPVRAAVMAHISPATHSRHNGQRTTAGVCGAAGGAAGVVGRHRRPVCAGR